MSHIFTCQTHAHGQGLHGWDSHGPGSHVTHIHMVTHISRSQIEFILLLLCNKEGTHSKKVGDWDIRKNYSRFLIFVCLGILRSFRKTFRKEKKSGSFNYQNIQCETVIYRYLFLYCNSIFLFYFFFKEKVRLFQNKFVVSYNFPKKQQNIARMSALAWSL